MGLAWHINVQEGGVASTLVCLRTAVALLCAHRRESFLTFASMKAKQAAPHKTIAWPHAEGEAWPTRGFWVWCAWPVNMAVLVLEGLGGRY